MTLKIGFMCAYNEADFIEYSIRSVIDRLDELIIFEGSWKECYEVNGKKRSDDGTVEILEKLQKEFSNLRVFHYNEDNQLIQRNRIFEQLPRDCWLWIVDADEVYDEENLDKIDALLSFSQDECIKLNSLTFANDFYNVFNIEFPRLFRIKPQNQYRFVAPNELAKKTPTGEIEKLNIVSYKDIRFWHYSYCHSPERFMEKKKERTKAHGHFTWELTNGVVHKPGGRIGDPYDGDHPEIMKTHPLYGLHTEKRDLDSEIICIVCHSGIGNTLHWVPTIKAIRKAKPKAKLYFLCWPRSSRILDGLQELDLVVDKDNQQFMASLQRPVDHLIVSPVGAIVTPAMLQMSKNVLRVEKDKLWTKHEALYNMEFAAHLGYKENYMEFECPVFESNLENWKTKKHLHGIPTEFVAITASYLKSDQWPLKHWGDKKYSALINFINQKYNLPCVLFGAQSDFPIAENILSDCLNQNYNLCGWSNDIKDTAAALKDAKLVVGNDGALQHIAASIGTPTVTIFTFTNLVKNRPLAHNARIVAKECPKRLECQHGQYNQCECLDVPVNVVSNSVQECLDEILHSDRSS